MYLSTVFCIQFQGNKNPTAVYLLIFWQSFKNSYYRRFFWLYNPFYVDSPEWENRGKRGRRLSMIKQCTSNNWRIQVPRLKGGINVKQKEGKWLKLGNIIKKFQDTKNKGKNTEAYSSSQDALNWWIKILTKTCLNNKPY